MLYFRLDQLRDWQNDVITIEGPINWKTYQRAPLAGALDLDIFLETSKDFRILQNSLEDCKYSWTTQGFLFTVHYRVIHFKEQIMTICQGLKKIIVFPPGHQTWRPESDVVFTQFIMCSWYFREGSFFYWQLYKRKDV